MAAYAAVVSLQRTISGILRSPRASSIRGILRSAYKEASSLLQALQGLDGSNRSRSSMERVDALEAQIRDSAHKLEDSIDFYELKQLEEVEEEGDEEGVMRQEIRSFGEAAQRLVKEYLAELSRDDDDTNQGTITHPDFGVEMDSDAFNFILRNDVAHKMRPDDRYIFVLLGEQGSGSRVIAKTFFENASEAGKFERWGWARVGPGCELKHVLMSLIAQIEAAEVDNESLVDATDDRLSEHLYKALENRCYMIALDGVEDVELLDYLRTKAFPDQSNGSVILVTTTSREVYRHGDYSINYFLTDAYDEDLWMQIRYHLFGWESIPEELEVAGREIVRNSRPMYISLAKALFFLSKTDMTVEQWSKIAADKDNPIFTVKDELSEWSEIQNELQNCKTRVAAIALQHLDFTENVNTLIQVLYPERFFSKMKIISFFGMTGIGKTTIVRNIFKHDSILSCFDHHVWIHIGPRYHSEEIVIDILAQINPHISKLEMKGDENLVRYLCAQVSNKRFLIVLDDLCSQDPLHHLREIFPGIKGTIMVTTRLPKVLVFGKHDRSLEMRLLDLEESWCLLCKKVFNGGSCPPELEKAGRKIAEKCDGLPLLILTVADQLGKVERSEEYWNNVASGKEKSIFKNAHHQISMALLPAYHNLPQHLKPSFLYMGVFLERHDIPISDLSNLLISEGFLKPSSFQMEEDFFEECLSELADRSLVMARRTLLRPLSKSPITVCRLHSVFWHLSNSQALKSKLFYALNSYDDCLIESNACQRRLCIRDNILLGMKDVQNAVASNTSAHSILCVGPLHQYPVPLNFDLRLLRVMDALTVRLYEFPTKVTSLFQMRYLSLTCNGELPISIYKLRKLQCLIVKRYMNIKSSKSSFYLPLEIWDMNELKHLQIMGGCLPDHTHGSGLPKLSTLLDVSAQSCREEVLQWIPNLKRLGIRVELAPTDESNSLLNLNGISYLDRLESFKCVVVNPDIGSKAVPPPALLSMLPPNLKKLSLSGLGYRWEHMKTIGKLRNLEVLKLKCYAFQGPKWEMDSTNLFEKLNFLLMEDTNLVSWKLYGDTYMCLERICIKHCYKLQDFPISLCCRDSLRTLEIIDCTPSLVRKAQDFGQIKRKLDAKTHCSWFDTHQE